MGIFELLFIHHLIFGLLGLVGLNRAWLYKDPKVSVLQANVQVAKKGKCWTLNQGLIRVPSPILNGGNILLLELFVFT